MRAYCPAVVRALLAEQMQKLGRAEGDKTVSPRMCCQNPAARPLLLRVMPVTQK